MRRKAGSTVEASEFAGNVSQSPAVERTPGVRAALELIEPGELSLTPIQLLALILTMILQDRITDEEIEKICTLYYDTVTKWYPPDLPSGI